MAYTAAAADVQRMFAGIAGRYDLANSVLSFGIHYWWRRALVRMLPEGPINRALDLCTGTGDLVPLLRRRAAMVVAADFCRPMLAVGQRKRPASGGVPLLWLHGDALKLPLAAESFDVVTVAFGVRNFENAVAGLREIARILKPGGTLLVLEFGQPQGALFGPVYRWYSRWIMPRIGGWLTGDREAYAYLPRTAGKFPCGAAFAELLRGAGFEPELARSLTFGIAYAYRATSAATTAA